MSDKDIVTDLLECAADSRATEGDYYADQFATAPEIFERAAAEIARLRLTDAERAAIRRLLHWVHNRPCSELPDDVETDHSIACEVFERLGGGR